MIAPTSFFSDYGCSVRILEEAKILQARGNELTICTYRNGKDIPGLTIRRTPSIPFREHYEVGSSPHKIGDFNYAYQKWGVGFQNGNVFVVETEVVGLPEPRYGG